MSRPRLLPPLAPETSAALGPMPDPSHPSYLDPRHTVNAEVDPRLLGLVTRMGQAERHLRFMVAPCEDSERETWGTCEGKPGRMAAQWAKRVLDEFTGISRVAEAAGDTAFPLHLDAIRHGLSSRPFPLRVLVWSAWKWCSTVGREKAWRDMDRFLESQCRDSTVKPLKCKPYVPTAGEIAAFVSESEGEFTAHDCINHLKALGLPYAPSRTFKPKSI